MAHFLAEYSCDGCDRSMGIFVSNNILLVSRTDNKYELLDPREIKVDKSFRIFCTSCMEKCSAEVDFTYLSFKCGDKNCNNGFFGFYVLPKEMNIWKEGEIKKIITKTILCEYNLAWCSVAHLPKDRKWLIQKIEWKKIE